jgi:hypothetical protein
VIEKHMSEIEKSLLYISEARERTERACKILEEDGTELHVIKAMREYEQGPGRGAQAADAGDLLRRSR